MLPLVFSFLGLGSASAVAVLQRYRNVFAVLAVGFLAFSFYLTFIRVRSHWVNRLLWGISFLVTVLVLGFLHRTELIEFFSRAH